jgi:peptidoglycan hydrolase-like protein with peptidoglycan-binding domain
MAEALRGRHRRLLALVAAALVGAAAVTVTVAVTGIGWSRPMGTDQVPPATGGTTAPITRRTLVESMTVPGRLDYGAALPVESKAPGTVTWLPAVGNVLGRGDALLRVDEVPVTVLFGSLPMYRPLRTGTKGRDVLQFEGNLNALGYVGFGVDEEFTVKTAAAVKRWQDDLDMPVTGVVDVARVVYLPGSVRVASLSVRPGASATAEVLTCTADRRVVTVDAPAGGAGWTSVGTRVSVRLPGGQAVTGTVAAVGIGATAVPPTGEDQPDAAAATAPAGTATVPVTISIADQGRLGRLQRTPVDVVHVNRQRKDVLAVPVAALLALQEGGYGLEVVDGTGSRVVAVTTGLFAGGLVEVRGAGIRAGLSVRLAG